MPEEARAAAAHACGWQSPSRGRILEWRTGLGVRTHVVLRSHQEADMATHVLRPGTKRGNRRHITLDEHLPVDHRLNQVYRAGAGLMGLVLLTFGILGLIDKIGFFDTRGDSVAGLSTNGALSVLSIVVGLLLLVGMVIGGNFASTLNTVLGVAFIVSGFVNLALLDSSHNFLAFRIQNVLFSFVVGVLLMTFGMYGRVSGGLPHDNPYWKARHPDRTD